MAFEYLLPVSDQVLAHNALLLPQSLGNSIAIHSGQEGLPELEGVQLAFLGISEHRNAFEQKTSAIDLDDFRKELYKLNRGNWKLQIVDLGNVPIGNEVEDTYVVVKEVVAELIQLGIVPIVIGATQDVSYPLYRSFDQMGEMINMVAIDHRFDFGVADQLISSHSYMSKIISESPTNLKSFTNLGYQSFFNTQEERDLMDKMYFDSYRLGEVVSDLAACEPLLRDAHFLSIDTRAIQASDMGSGTNYTPNGLNGREICALTRYAGLSPKLSLFGVFESDNHPMSNRLIAQMVWYFIEGFSIRIVEDPLRQSEYFLKYTVTLESLDLIFFKSKKTSRWWVQLEEISSEGNNFNSSALLPCSENDYKEACKDLIPERWIKAQKKGFC
jgi:hypothetical protein